MRKSSGPKTDPCHTLESVTTAKYLGITISKDMNWDTHINNITSKANKIIDFLRRNLPIQNTEAKTLAYKSMVRSNLEYCANIWSPKGMTFEDVAGVKWCL
jgi:hypothetical protein